MLPGISGVSGFSVTDAPVLSLTWQSVFGTATDATSYTSGTITFGSVVPAGETRHIIVATHGCVNTTLGQINSVTIGGNSATRLYQISNSQGRPTELWYITNNALTSGVVNVVTSTTQSSFGFSVWRLANPLSITPSFTSGGTVLSSTTNTRSITVPTGGVGMCLCSPNFSSGSISWTNAVEQYEQEMQSGQTCSGAITTTPGTYDITATMTGSQNNTLVLACWE